MLEDFVRPVGHAGFFEVLGRPAHVIDTALEQGKLVVIPVLLASMQPLLKVIDLPRGSFHLSTDFTSGGLVPAALKPLGFPGELGEMLVKFAQRGLQVFTLVVTFPVAFVTSFEMLAQFVRLSPDPPRLVHASGPLQFLGFRLHPFDLLHHFLVAFVTSFEMLAQFVGLSPDPPRLVHASGSLQLLGFGAQALGFLHRLFDSLLARLGAHVAGEYEPQQG
jgi:hypothetical protein